MISTRETRQAIIRMAARTEGGHIGANLSAVEIVHTLYSRVLNVDPTCPDWPNRDRFLCKGHVAALLYVILAARKFFPEEQLLDYNTDGTSVFPIVDMYSLPGVEASTTSMGRGLSLGIGMALAARADERNYQTYVMVGDGECQEGQLWEAAMLAPTLGLNNLTLIIDRNRYQASTSTDDVMAGPGFTTRFAAFGWDAWEIDGHCPDAIEHALSAPRASPRCVVANTTKGKGLSFMENDVTWHGRSLTRAELTRALRELR